MNWILALLYLILGIIVILIIIRYYIKHFYIGKYEITQDLSEKTFLVTGANSGIGLATTEQLAFHGATVHMLCRTVGKSSKVAESIKKKAKNGRIFVWNIDMGSLESIRNFANRFLATKQPIDCLINNAATLKIKREETPEGLEKTMATNHYGPFLLTHLLLNRMKKRPHARIVNVSSGEYKYSQFSMQNPHLEYGYDVMHAYRNSKLFMNLCTQEMAERLKDTNVTVNSLCPGVAYTNAMRDFGTSMQVSVVLLSPFIKTATEGAATSLYLATSPEVSNKSGMHFAGCVAEPYVGQATDRVLQEEVWKLSENVTGLSLSED